MVENAGIDPATSRTPAAGSRAESHAVVLQYDVIRPEPTMSVD